MTTVPRTLVNVQQELSDALQRKTRDMLKIGSLLNEAKTFVEHGELLPWLRRHTALAKRSAQNYMKAAAWADALDLKNAGAALFEPNLDHLSLEAILVLASGKLMCSSGCVGGWVLPEANRPRLPLRSVELWR